MNSYCTRHTWPMLFAFALLLGSCSLGFQKSVRSSGTLCSESRGWFLADAALAGAAGYFAATELNEPTAFIPTGVLLTSAAIGMYKRRNCIGHRENATPEQWAHDRAKAKRQAEEQAARERIALAERAEALSRAVAARERAHTKAQATAQARRDAYDREYDERARARSAAERRRNTSSPRPASPRNDGQAHPAPPKPATIAPASPRSAPQPAAPAKKPRGTPIRSASQCTKVISVAEALRSGGPSFAELRQRQQQTCVACINQQKVFYYQSGGGLNTCSSQ